MFEEMLELEYKEGAPSSPDDYAYVPDPKKSSTWKLQIQDATHIAGAITALTSGFRGNKVEIPAAAKAGVWRKIASAINKLPDGDTKDNLKKRLSESRKDYSKAYMGLLPQDDVNYTTLSTKTAKACANCRWFIASGTMGDDGDGDNDCHLVSEWPQPILPTGLCDRWEAMPTPPEPDTSPIPVTIVQPDADDMQMSMEQKPVTEDGLFSRIWERIQARLTPDKEQQAFTVFKDKDGKDHWIARYTNNFKDRDSEIISEKALSDYYKRVDIGIVPKPELWNWHVPGTRHGVADEVFGIGHFGYAIGHYDDTPMGKAAAEYDRKHQKDIALSHGFTAPIWSFQDGVYKVANTFEITTLPRGKESNPFTSFEEIKKMELSEAKRRHLEDIYGKDRVDQIVAEAEKHGKDLEALQVEYKDAAAVSKEPAAKPDSALADMVLELTKSQGELVTLMSGFLKAQKEKETAAVTKEQTLQKANEGLAAEVAELRKLVNAGPQAASQTGATISKEEAEALKAKAPNANDKRMQMREFMGLPTTPGGIS